MKLTLFILALMLNVNLGAVCYNSPRFDDMNMDATPFITFCSVRTENGVEVKKVYEYPEKQESAKNADPFECFYVYEPVRDGIVKYPRVFAQ